MTHLAAAEIQEWYEHGHAADRARVIGHLAECETCRRSLSTYAAAAEPETSSTLISISEAVPRGYAAKKPPQTTRNFGWLRPAYGLAAAAIIVLAVVWITAPDRNGDDGAVRGTELIGLAPLGASNAGEFSFATPFQASKYRLTVRDANGALVLSTETRNTRVAIDAASRSRLIAGQEYSWVVTAFDTAGETIAESAPAKFRYQP